ncbi:hypothetical protein KZO01_14000 [Kurthia zopfii]|uniref:Protein of uncharacterized function (DUF1565) n=1 Tax=Kurthia zopfii TaxID=1650 RepID=A0A8B4QCT9_9BACL|nr:right-handed parallel beta-helix repeat-containing protein [Kurthia zopfii]PWI23662.1 hypothetical protein DF281_02170 [Kurthia zopfii]TDR42654.1 hypothetical protein DFR61_10329 [Kurthia zopfii]GEK31091.1 hypothetical protein KZO01_14000 [Kurthia zopfii]STX10509.1 Protein of uncharacterised function (DUF1565) [Kurthia zopfii]
MKKIFMILSLFTIIAVVAGCGKSDAEAKSIYVATDGNDQAKGTEDAPYKTLKKASSVAKAGTIVYIRKGTYDEKLIVKNSGTKKEPVIFKAHNSEKVILSGKKMKDTNQERAMVSMHNKSNVIIEGLTVQDMRTKHNDATIMGFYISGKGENILLKNNHVRNIKTLAKEGNAHGIAFYGSEPMKNIRVIDNTLENMKLGASETLVLNGDISQFKIIGNNIRNSDNIGIDLIGFEGVAKNRKNDYVRDGIVNDNKVTKVSAYGNPAYGKNYGAGGIYIDGGKNIIVEDNHISYSDIGIEATSEHKGKYADRITIRNNVVEKNYFTGISIGGYDVKRGGTRNSEVSKNVLYRNDTKKLGGGQLLLQHDVEHNKVEKNVMTASSSGIMVANYFKSNVLNNFSKNIFHKELGKKTTWVWKKREYSSFEVFKKVSKSDADTKFIDPHYRDEKSGDYRLQKGSKAYLITK